MILVLIGGVIEIQLNILKEERVLALQRQFSGRNQFSDFHSLNLSMHEIAVAFATPSFARMFCLIAKVPFKLNDNEDKLVKDIVDPSQVLQLPGMCQ